MPHYPLPRTMLLHKPS